MKSIASGARISSPSTNLTKENFTFFKALFMAMLGPVLV